MEKLKSFLSVLLCLTMLSAFACAGAESAAFQPGTFTGVGNGCNGEISVEAEVSENTIVSVKVVSHSETTGICEAAFERFPPQSLRSRALRWTPLQAQP